MKPLSETNRYFRGICAPRLTHLRLDHYKLGLKNATIDIRRAYKEISVTGFEKLSDWEGVDSALTTSRESAKLLRVVEVPFGLGRQASMQLESLMLPLRKLPKLEQIVINRAVKSTRGAPDVEKAQLPELKKVIVSRKSQQALRGFVGVTSLTELKIPFRITTISLRSIATSLIHAQNNLVILEADMELLASLPANQLPNLRIFIGRTVYWRISDILKIAPALEHLSLKISRPAFLEPEEMRLHSRQYLDRYFFDSKSLALKTLNLTGTDIRSYMNVRRYIRSFPNLEISKCSPVSA